MYPVGVVNPTPLLLLQGVLVRSSDIEEYVGVLCDYVVGVVYGDHVVVVEGVPGVGERVEALGYVVAPRHVAMVIAHCVQVVQVVASVLHRVSSRSGVSLVGGATLFRFFRFFEDE